EARQRVAEVGTIERSVFVDLSREKASAQGTKWNKTDSELFERRKYFLFGLSPPQRIFALHCNDRLDGVRATNRLRSRFGKAEVLYLAFLNQILHRAGHVFDWHGGIDAVLIE